MIASVSYPPCEELVVLPARSVATVSSSERRPSSTNRSVAAATNGFVTLAMRNREPATSASRRAVGHPGRDLGVDSGCEHMQQSTGHLRPHLDVAIDERLERGVQIAHGWVGTSRRTLFHGRTRSSAAPMRKALTSSKVRPTICTPVGTPFDATPLGTPSTGHGESTLNGVVM